MSYDRGPVQSLVRLLEVFALTDEASVRAQTLETVAESFDSEAVGIVCDDSIIESIGFGSDATPLVAVASAGLGAGHMMVDRLGMAHTLSLPLEGQASARFVLVRTSGPFSSEESAVIRAMARMMRLAVRTVGAFREERRTTVELERQVTANRELADRLHERHLSLMERILDIQQVVTKASTDPESVPLIVQQAGELFERDAVIVSLRDEIDGRDRWTANMTSLQVADLFDYDPTEHIARRACHEQTMIVDHDYVCADGPGPALAASAMSAPIYSQGAVIGSVSVLGQAGSEHLHDEEDQEALLIIAGYLSVAATEAATTRLLQVSLGEAQWRATHDHLTGLPNRARIIEIVDERLASGEQPTLLYIDFDGFKTVNDLYGHGTGDQALVAMAARMMRSLRAGEAVSRLAGDEFLVVLPELTREGARAAARRLIAGLKAPLEIDGRQLAMPPSIGVASFPAKSAEELLDAADLAMYKAKRSSGERVAFFDDELRRKRNRRVQLEQKLRLSVVEMDDFDLHFQPIVTADRHVCGVEALLRWCDPVLGQVPPDEFISVAEETGSVTQIDVWALRNALANVGALPDEVARAVRVSVNFSPASFLVPNLRHLVEAVLRESGMGADRLAIEITERVMLGDHRLVLRNIEGLRDLGVAVVLDDFGTGYSSLSYLRTLDVDGLKIDRAFVTGAVADKRGEAILSSVIRMAADLGSQTVAEGVETVEQMELLQSLGCDRFQGYLFGRPLPLADDWSWHRHPSLIMSASQTGSGPAHAAAGPVSRNEARAVLPAGL